MTLIEINQMEKIGIIFLDEIHFLLELHIVYAITQNIYYCILTILLIRYVHIQNKKSFILTS
jgi:hypothetical protein